MGSAATSGASGFLLATAPRLAPATQRIKLDEVTTDMLGTCKETEVSKHATTTLDGAGDREALGKRTDLLRSTTGTTTPD